MNFPTSVDWPSKRCGRSRLKFKYVEFNRFKLRTSHAFISQIRFGTCEIRRLDRAFVENSQLASEYTVRQCLNLKK